MTALRRLGLALAGLALCAPPALAQEGEAGGLWLRLSLDQRLEAQRNADLAPDPEGTTWRSSTRLGLALSSVTPTDTLVFSLNGALRATEAPRAVEDERFGLKEPSAALRYSHRAADARLEASLSASRRQIAYLRSLEEILADLDAGDSFALEDLDEETGSGRRDSLQASAALRLGVSGPAELGFGLDATLLRYEDAGPSYLDSERFGARSDVILRLAPALSLRTALGYSRFEEKGESPRETWTLGSTLVQERPAGSLSARLDLAHIEEGTRATLGLGWERQRPDGALGLDLGVTRSAGGTLGLSGALNWRRDLPDGRLQAQLSQRFGADSDDRETRVTRVTAGYAKALDPLTDLSLDIAHVQTASPEDDGGQRRSEIGAALTRQLDPDWRLSLGYRHIWADEDDSGPAQSDTLYLSIGRSLAIRF
jgi:hypothetical protein